MLVLTRTLKGNERAIHIGPDIKVTLEQVSNTQARIGVEAPKHMVIMRGELVQNGASLGGAVPVDDLVEIAVDHRNRMEACLDDVSYYGNNRAFYESKIRQIDAVLARVPRKAVA